MKNYVVGFMFDSGKDRIVLIKKLKPEWQKGKLNGVGGSIETGESPLIAMVREFEEETGVKTAPTNWINFMYAMDAENQVHLHMFKCIDHNNEFVIKVKTVEAEKIGVYHIEDIISCTGRSGTTVPNLQSIIPIALNDQFKFVKVFADLSL